MSVKGTIRIFDASSSTSRRPRGSPEAAYAGDATQRALRTIGMTARVAWRRRGPADMVVTGPGILPVQLRRLLTASSSP